MFLSKRQSLAGSCLQLKPSAADSLGALGSGDSKTAAGFCKERGERSRDSLLCPQDLTSNLNLKEKPKNSLSCAPALEFFHRTKYLVWFHSLRYQRKINSDFSCKMEEKFFQ